MKMFIGGLAGGFLVALVLTFSCRGEGIDRATAAHLAARVDSLSRADSLARARFDSLSTVQDSSAAAWSLTEDSLKRVAQGAGQAATAALVNTARQSGSLRQALVDGRLCPPWCAVFDSIVTAYDTALDEKDRQLTVTEQIADGLRQQNENLGVLLSAAREALATSELESRTKDTAIAFWQAEAERLEAQPRIEIKAPIGVALAAFGGGTIGYGLAKLFK